MACVITLTGPAHCGKSTVRNHFLERATPSVFEPVLFKKYTTRKRRKNDDDVDCVSQIPAECDAVYEQYGVRYGFQLGDLYKKLEEGKSPIIVINDIRVVEDVQAAFGSLSWSIFIYREPAILENFIKEETERSAGLPQADVDQVAQDRYQKAQAIIRIYIENIQLFDHVILNVSDEDFISRQVNHIVNKVSQTTEALKNDEKRD